MGGSQLKKSCKGTEQSNPSDFTGSKLRTEKGKEPQKE